VAEHHRTPTDAQLRQPGSVASMTGMGSWLLGHHAANPYFAFTDACNARQPVVILASGQACVWFRLALASKDGDWIAREDADALAAIRAELGRRQARYRLGAPLDVRWLAAGWSAHFESVDEDGMRHRFDFVSRPPRLPADRLAELWASVAAGATAVVTRQDLIQLKRTMRLKDYAFIGALATQLPDPADQVRWTLDPEHLAALLADHPGLAERLHELRPGCAGIPPTPAHLAIAIDAEIRADRHVDERRIQAYSAAMQPWTERFRTLGLDELPLAASHLRCCEAAHDCLPTSVAWT
jgi:hypothetical protein